MDKIVHIMHNYLQHLNHFESLVKKPAKSLNTLLNRTYNQP